jgi:transketolase
MNKAFDKAAVLIGILLAIAIALAFAFFCGGCASGRTGKMLEEVADRCRKEVIANAVKHNKGHIAPSLSTVDVLVALYYEVLRKDDVFILSKGHGCYALYWILQDKGIMPKEVWDEWRLPGCLEREPAWEIPCSTGSMGHGLPQAVGLAWGKMLQKQPGRVYCMVGDGEMQEGSNWEALIIARESRLDNLTVIVDSNLMQAMDFTALIAGPPSTLKNSFYGFGLRTNVVNGHNMEAIVEVLEQLRASVLVPVVIAETKKGQGMPCSYYKPEFHYRVPTKTELEGEE